jgi:hypothetical protein
MLKVHFYHHTLATKLLTNLLTKSSQKQITHIFVLFVNQKFFANQIGLLLNWLRQLCKRVWHQVSCRNVMVETHLKKQKLKLLKSPIIAKHGLNHLVNECTALSGVCECLDWFDHLFLLWCLPADISKIWWASSMHAILTTNKVRTTSSNWYVLWYRARGFCRFVRLQSSHFRH